VSNVAVALRAGKCIEEEERHYIPLKRRQGEVTRQIDREDPLSGNSIVRSGETPGDTT